MPAPASRPKPKFRTLADVQARLGHVPEARILSLPAPGTATARDLLDGGITRGWPVELVDGVLVLKVCGWGRATVGARLATAIGTFLVEHNVGLAAGARGPIRLGPDLVRQPDVSFIRWDSVDDPDEIENPAGAFLEYPPDLAVEVLSPGNSVGEMDVRLREYAKAKVRLVWYVDPERREVDVYPRASAKRMKTLTAADTLDGGDVLPGFAVPVAKLFEKRAPAKKPGKKGRK
ncbi:MAG: Uma2 family endonuclease [Isosphaera sp.]|nr:Uma2 family endonuclease [Isosphaera sp.]